MLGLLAIGDGLLGRAGFELPAVGLLVVDRLLAAGPMYSSTNNASDLVPAAFGRSLPSPRIPLLAVAAGLPKSVF